MKLARSLGWWAVWIAALCLLAGQWQAALCLLGVVVVGGCVLAWLRRTPAATTEVDLDAVEEERRQLQRVRSEWRAIERRQAAAVAPPARPNVATPHAVSSPDGPPPARVPRRSVLHGTPFCHGDVWLVAVLAALLLGGCAPVEGRPPGPIAPTVRHSTLRERGIELAPGCNRDLDLDIYRAVWAEELAKPRKPRVAASPITVHMPGAVIVAWQN